MGYFFDFDAGVNTGFTAGPAGVAGAAGSLRFLVIFVCNTLASVLTTM
jgi:hypothetical protein